MGKKLAELRKKLFSKLFPKLDEMVKSMKIYFLALLRSNLLQFFQKQQMTSVDLGGQNKIHELNEIKKLSTGYSFLVHL